MGASYYFYTRYPNFASGIFTRSESRLRHFGTTSIPGPPFKHIPSDPDYFV